MDPILVITHALQILHTEESNPPYFGASYRGDP